MSCAFRGRSQTMLTKVCLLLTTYLPSADTVEGIVTCDYISDTTYLPRLVTVVRVRSLTAHCCLLPKYNGVKSETFLFFYMHLNFDERLNKLVQESLEPCKNVRFPSFFLTAQDKQFGFLKIRTAFLWFTVST